MKKLLFLTLFFISSINASYLIPFFDLYYQIDFMLKLPDVKAILNKEQGGKEQMASIMLTSLALQKSAPVHMQAITTALARIVSNHVAYQTIKDLHLETEFNRFVSDEESYWKRQEKLLEQIPTIKIVLDDAGLKDELLLEFFKKSNMSEQALNIMHEKVLPVTLQVIELIFKKLDEIQKK